MATIQVDFGVFKALTNILPDGTQFRVTCKGRTYTAEKRTVPRSTATAALANCQLEFGWAFDMPKAPVTPVCASGSNGCLGHAAARPLATSRAPRPVASAIMTVHQIDRRI
jgi:hypothetical protein